MKTKKLKLVYIEWADAVSPTEGSWWTKEEALDWLKTDDFWIESIGWVLLETKDMILISSKKATTQTGKNIEQYGELFKIPKPWIRKRKELKI